MERACYWIAKTEGGALTTAEEQEFTAWRSDPVNQSAFQKVRRVWGLFDQAGEDPHLRAMRRAALALQPRRGPFTRARVATLAILVFGIGAFVALPQLRAGSAWLVSQVLDVIPHAEPEVTQYATAVGDRLDVTLPDGTSVLLNTNTVVEVAYTDARRSVRLRRGQAFFDVTHDASRTFVVETQSGAVTAVGTAFDVLVTPDRFQVLVEEGKVTIAANELVDDANLLPELPVVRGQRYLDTGDTPPQISEVDIARQLRWRTGFVEFDDVTLAEAIREMNRYSSHVAALRDDRVAALRVSGVFRIGQLDRFLDVASELLPIQVARPLGAPIVISLNEAAAGHSSTRTPDK